MHYYHRLIRGDISSSKEHVLFKKLITALVLLAGFIACGGTNYSGTYTGTAWKGEAQGVTLEDATSKIETTLSLDKQGVITDLKMAYWSLKDGEWVLLSDQTATVKVDTTLDPTPAVIGKDYSPGQSMFTIKINYFLGFYAVAVSEDGTVAYGLAEPNTRYLMEAKFPSGYDFSQPFGSLTIGDQFIPTTRVSAGGYYKPESLEELAGRTLLNVTEYSFVLNRRGVYEGISEDSSIQEFLERAGVQFVNGLPQPMEPKYGFHGAGGWQGNYRAIAQALVGKNAKDVKSLFDFDGKGYMASQVFKDSVNEDGFFGINTDTVSTATKAIQLAYDTVTGATVRISRENTSFQRALVAAGIMAEEDVIKGRF